MKLFLMLCAVFAIAACSSVTKEDLGLSRRSPDERMVEQKAPLSLPPEFDVRPVVSETM